MNIKSIIKGVFEPSPSRRELLEEAWNERPKTTRLVWEFENGVVNELVGDHANNYGKGLFLSHTGFLEEGKAMVKESGKYWRKVQPEPTLEDFKREFDRKLDAMSDEELHSQFNKIYDETETT